MIELVVLLTVLIPVALALIWPNGLVLAALLTGVLPLTLGPEGMMVTVFGRMDLYAIRLLGLWIASLLVILPRSLEAGKYGFQFHWHLLFLTFAVLSLVWSPSAAYGARMIVKLSAPFIFLLLVLVACSSWRDLRRMQYAMVVSGLLAIAIGVIAIWGGYSTFSTQLGLGVPGLGPAATSANLAVLSVLALALLCTAPGWLAALLLGLFAAGAVAGFTRITIAGLLFGVSVVLWMSMKGLVRWLIPLAGAVSVPALFSLSDTFRQRMFKNDGDISLDLLLKDPTAALDNIHGSGRFEAWSYVLTSFFKPSPFFGSGVGTTQNYFYTHATGLNVIHSEYIRLLAELGVLGVALMGIAVAAYMIRLVRTCRASSTREGRAYSLAALGGVVIYVIFMATDNAIDYVTSCGIFVFALIAMSEKARELEQQNSLVQGHEFQSSASVSSHVEEVPCDPVPFRRFPLVSWR